MNDDYYSTPKPRTNNLISSNQSNINQPLHLFTKPSILSPPIGILKVQCKNKSIPIQIHQTTRQFTTLINNNKQKIFIVIQTPRQSATQISSIFPSTYAFPQITAQNIKMVTYPGLLSNSNYGICKDQHQVLKEYEKFFVQKSGTVVNNNKAMRQSSKVKLRSVHSSKDIKYSLVSQQSNKKKPTSSNKNQIFFQKLLYNDYKVSSNNIFKDLTQSINHSYKIQPVGRYQDVKMHLQKLNKQNKLLLLVDQDNLSGFKNYIDKEKLAKRVFFIVFAQVLHPAKILLDKNVYFASSDGLAILDQLEKLGFNRINQCKTEYMRLTTDHKNRFRFSTEHMEGKIEPFTNNIKMSQVKNLGYVNVKSFDKPQLHRISQKSILSNASSVMQRYVRTWTIDLDPNAPNSRDANYIITQQGKHQIDLVSQPLSKRASRLTIGNRSRHSSSMDSERILNNLSGKQQNLNARIKQKQSDVNILMPVASQQFQFVKLHNSHKQINKPQTLPTSIPQSGLQKHSNKKIITLTKKSQQPEPKNIQYQQQQTITSSTTSLGYNYNNRHQTKHQQMPSNVIQQMSDQYRGSNRESIVNMDDHFYHYNGSGNANSLTNSANNMTNSMGSISNQNFSRFKNSAGQSVEQPGNKRVVQNSMKVAPANTEIIRQTYENAYGYQKDKNKDLPIYSPSHSEVKQKFEVINMQPIVINGSTGDPIGNGMVTLKHQLNLLSEGGRMLKPVVIPNRSTPPDPNTLIINGSTGQLDDESKLKLQTIKRSKISAYNNNTSQRVLVAPNNYSNNQSQSYEQKNSLPNRTYEQSKSKAYIINGSTGQLQGNSRYQMDQIRKSITDHQAYTLPSRPTSHTYNYDHYLINSNKSQQQISNNLVNKQTLTAQQNIIRPSHYIQPEIIKIPYESKSSIGSSNVATQRKITNNNYIDKNNNVESTTSIKVVNHNQNYAQNNKTNPLYNRYQYNTTTINHTTDPSYKNVTHEVRYNSPSNYQSSNTNTNNSNYKVYTAEEYNAKYGHNANNSTDANKRVISSSSSYNNYYTTNNQIPQTTYTTTYGTNSNSNNYYTSPITTTTSNVKVTSIINSNETKQPEVINRVYIKASDLPDRVNRNGIEKQTTTYTTTKRYDTTTLSPSHTYTKQQYRDYNGNTIKLSAQDLDPFNEHLTPSKYSTMRKKSYLKRKEDGRRDPYSPYDEDVPVGSRIRRDSGVKVYSVDQYTTNNHLNGIDLNKYQKVIQNGITVYRAKNVAGTNVTGTTSTYQKINIPKAKSKVIEQTYETQPITRENYHQGSTNSRTTIVNGYQSGGITRYQPTGREYANSPTRREGSSYEKGLHVQNPLRRNSQERTGYYQTTTTTSKNVIPLRSQQAQIKPLVYDSKSPMKVSEYRTSTQNTYTYQSPTKHVVARRQIIQPRVQASNFNPRITQTSHNPKTKKFPNQNQIGVISGIQQKNSQIFELSDGSIMRRNNIKFGINKYRNSDTQNNKFQDSYEYLQEMKSKIKSKIITISQINRNYSIQKKLLDQDQIQFQKQAYSYINTAVNQFYFLVDQQLQFLQSWLIKFLKCKNDRIQKFRGIDQMYQKINLNLNQFDVIFLFVKKQDINKINKRVIPEDCYIVQLMPEDYKGLEISEKSKTIKLSKLPYMKLAQKIIIETMLNHIILYQKFNQKNNSNKMVSKNNHFEKQVTHLLSLFPEGHFVKQFYEEPLTLELIYGLVDDPKFNRLYVICDEKQMVNVVKQLNKIQSGDAFPKQICKIICVSSQDQILKFEQKIQKYPKVAWMTNVSKIHDYKSLIKYALRQDQDDNLYQKKQQTVDQIQKIYYHSRHKNLAQAIQKTFPSRFEFQIFNSLADVQKKIIKGRNQLNNSNKFNKDRDPSTGKQIRKSLTSPNKKPVNTVNYLILHPILSEEYIETKLFKKIYMLGKSDKIQRKVVKVGNVEELVELLKK